MTGCELTRVRASVSKRVTRSRGCAIAHSRIRSVSAERLNGSSTPVGLGSGPGIRNGVAPWSS
jgi:hypothetical protein